MSERHTMVFLTMSVLGLLLVPGPVSGAASAGETVVDTAAITNCRIVFTDGVFGGYNRDDAIAAIDVWFRKIARDKNIPIAPVIEVCENGNQFQRIAQNENFDFLGVRTDEYLPFKESVQQDQLFGVMQNGTFAVEYLLLTRSGGPYMNVEDLQNRSITILDTAGAAMAPIWLDTVLMRSGLPPSSMWFESVERHSKVSRTLLPVFFGKVDACVVTRAAFETMSELNPQVGAMLRPVASSPVLVAAMIGFRSGYDPALTEEIVEAVMSLHQDTQGQQILLVFGADRIVRLVPEDLDSVRSLIQEYEQLSDDGLTTGGGVIDDES